MWAQFIPAHAALRPANQHVSIVSALAHQRRPLTGNYIEMNLVFHTFTFFLEPARVVPHIAALATVHQRTTVLPTMLAQHMRAHAHQVPVKPLVVVIIHRPVVITPIAVIAPPAVPTVIPVHAIVRIVIRVRAQLIPAHAALRPVNQRVSQVSSALAHQRRTLSRNCTEMNLVFFYILIFVLDTARQVLPIAVLATVQHRL